LELLPLLIYSSSSLIPACVESEVVPLALMFHACTPLLADFGDLGCDRTGLDGASFCDQENFKNALVNHQTSESALRARYKVVLFFGLPLENDFPGAVIAESTALRKVQPGKTALLSKTFDRGRRR
jgi:hypothetical protein